MLTWIREKFGPVMIGLIVGFIAFVFIFSGVISPSRTKGLHEGSVAGVVNGEAISLQDFSRALNQRIEFYKQMSGGKITEAQIKAARLREGVFQEMVSQKLSSQAAEKSGMAGSDEEVRERVRQYPAFQKDGKFDTATYKMVLQANQLTPGGFEKMVRDEVAQQAWQSYFRDRVRTSESELKREFQISNDKRNIRYVLLTSEVGKKGVKIPPAEIEKFLKDASKLSMVKAQYEMKKTTEYKGVTFDQAKERIAHQLLAAEKVDDIKKFNENLAGQIVGMLGTDKASEAKVNALLKPYDTTVKATGPVTRQNPNLPGVGEAKELMADAFAAKSPIDGKAKKYSSGNWTLVAVVTETQKPDFSKLTEQKDTLVRQLNFRKERALQDAWMKRLKDNSKIEMNEAVMAGGES